MRRRCNSPGHHKYKSYGGRGIKICKRWDDFANFLADMGDRPTGCTLDRKDNEGNYTPDNCRWASAKVQMRNRSNSLQLSYNGTTQALSAWAEELDIPYSCLHYRLKMGWSTERILETPSNKKPSI